ncbi:hypothetical protein L484_004535 [Morus notabilis]|uniref:Uncharacterized protein n=1 Tax=Morus notabilis TaxID=981085 RepID=W9SJ73_9ROSA|nr:hypothetical protein L484_004535 [Morus notabilis]
MANPPSTTLFLSLPRLSDDVVVALNEVNNYQSAHKSAAGNDLFCASPSSFDPTPSSLRWRHELGQYADRPAMNVGRGTTASRPATSQ